MSLYTSRDEFDLEKRVHLTNEIPPYDMYDALNSTLQNELWQWVLGYTRVTFDMPYAIKKLNEDDTVSMVRNVEEGNVFYKLINGEYSESYGPKGTVDDNLTYPQLEEYGVVLPEFDYLLHEVYRYLDTLYPDHPDYMELLTNNEFNDMITNAGAIIDYDPNNAFFEKVASSLGISDNDVDIESAMIKIRNLKDEAFRRKLYGSKSGYHMFASDIYQNVTVFPVATYLPLKPNQWNNIVKEFGEGSPYNQGEGDLESLKAWNVENGTNYSVNDYVKHILTRNREIDTYSKLYYSKFRLIDYDGSKSSYPVPRDNNIYISAFSLPFNEYSIFEYPVGSDADSMLVEATSGMVTDKNDVKGTNYITELNVDIPQLIPVSDSLIYDSKSNMNKLMYGLEESNGREVHSISTSLKNAVDFQKLYLYPYIENVKVSPSSFDSVMFGVEYQDDKLPLVDENGIVTVKNPFGDFFNGVRNDIDVKEIKAIYNPIATDTLFLSSDVTLGFYPTEVGCYYDVSNLGGGYFCKETPILWGNNGIEKFSYLTCAEKVEDFNESSIAQIVGFTKGYIGFANDSTYQYRSSKVSSIPNKDESYGRDRFAFVVENEHGNKVFFEGNLHNEDFPEQSRTISINGGISTFSFGTNGVTLFETVQGRNFHADYVELQVTAIPDKKTPSIMKSVYGDEYYELLSEEVNMDTDEKVGIIPREKDWLTLVVNNYEKNHLLNATEYKAKKQEIRDWLEENKDLYYLYKWGNVEEDFIFEHYYADDQIFTINGKVRNLGEEIYYLVKDLLGYIRMDTSEFMEHIKLYKESKDRKDQMIENRAFICEKSSRTLESGETEEIISSLIQPGCKVTEVFEGVVSYEKGTLKPYVSYSPATELGFGLITNISLGHLNVVSLFDKTSEELASPAYDANLADNTSVYIRRVKKQITNKCEIQLNSEDEVVSFVENFLTSVGGYENSNVIVPISSKEESDIMFMQNEPFIDGQESLCKDSTYRVDDAENFYALSKGEYKIVEMGTRYKYDMFNEIYFEDADGSFVKTMVDDTYTPITNVCKRKVIYKNIEFDYDNFVVKFDKVIQDGVQTVKYNYVNIDRTKVVPSQYTLTVSEIYSKSRNVAIIDTTGNANFYATGTLDNFTCSSVERGSLGNNLKVRFEIKDDILSVTVSLYDVDVYHKGGLVQEGKGMIRDSSTNFYYTDGDDREDTSNDGTVYKYTNFLKNKYVNFKWNGFTNIKSEYADLSGGYYYLNEYYDLISDRVNNPFVIKNHLNKEYEYIFDYNSPVISLMGDNFRDYVAGNYFAGKDSANVVISDDERTELKIESVINISEGRENRITFVSDLAKEMMKSLSIGDKVYGPSLDTDDNDIYIRSIGDNEITVSQPLQQSGTFVLTYYVKVNIYPDDLTDDMLYYKEALYKNGLYSVKNPYEHGLFGSSDYPRISNALLESLPDISFFDLTPSSMPGSWNVPSMNKGGDTTFQWLLKETHFDDYNDYILSRKNNINYDTSSPYKLLPSDIKFNNELFVEYNLNRLLKYPSRNGDKTVLMSVDWFDYMETNLPIISRATDKVNVGVNLMLETDTSGYYTWLPHQSYTDPNIQSRFITLNFHNNKWPEKGIMDDDWTVPVYAQIGSGGSGRRDMFKNPNDVTYPNMYGVSLYNDYVPTDQYSQGSDLVKSNGKLNTVTLYADKGYIIGTNAETSLGNNYDSVENPLFEVPLGEYNTVLKYKPSNAGDSDELLGTVTQVSFHEQTYKDLTKYFDEDEEVISIQNENSESMGILSKLCPRRETLNKGTVLNGDGSPLIDFVYGGDWIPKLSEDQVEVAGQMKNVIDYEELKPGRYYYISDNTNYTDMVEGERGNFSKGDIIFVYKDASNKVIYDTRSFQYICPFGDKYEDENNSEDVVSSLNYPVYDEDGKAAVLDMKKKKVITGDDERLVEIDDPADTDNKADIYTRLLQYYFRVSGNYTINQVKEEVNKCTLERLLDTYNRSGSLEERKKILDTHILYYAYVGSKESTGNGWDLKKRYFGEAAKFISEGDRIAMVFINGIFYLFKLLNTSVYGVSLPVKALGAGALKSELQVMNGKIKLSKDDSSSTTMKMNDFMSKLDLPHGNITPGSYEFNFTLDPHFVSTGYLYEDDGVTLDKTRDTVSFCITRGAIYYDSKNDEFYCFSKLRDPNTGDFVGDVRKIAIVFNENSYFKNVLNINGTYQIANTIESESGEVKSTPVFKPITGVNFPLDKVASNDRILGAKLVDLRSIYNRALEPTYFSTFAKISYGIYGINPREILLAPVPDDTGANKAKFVATIDNIYPQIAEYDDDKNVITVRNAGIEDGFNFVDDNTLEFPTVYDQIGLYHTEILRSPLRDTYVTDATQSLSNFEFKYFKNNLVVRAALNMAAPNTIVAPSKDSSLYFMALGEIGLGDSVVGGVSLSNMGFENKFSVQVLNADDPNDTVKIRKLCYADGHMLVIGMNYGIYYADNIDLGSISGKIPMKKSLIRLENDATPMDASFDYEKDSWMVEAGDLSTKNTDIYQLPVSMLGVPDQEPYLSVYKTNSSVFIKSDNKTLFVGASVDAKWDEIDNLPDNLEQANESYYLDLDNNAIVKDFISMDVSTGQINEDDYNHRDVLYRDIAISYGNLTEESHSNGERLVLTVNPATESDQGVPPNTGSMEYERSPMLDSKDITMEPYYVDSLRLVTGNGTNVPVDNGFTATRAVHVSSSSKKYALYAKGRDAFIKSPTALIVPKKDISGKYYLNSDKSGDYSKGYEYSGETTSDSYWKRARIPTISDKLFYNLRSMAGANMDNLYDTLINDAKDAFAKLGAFENVNKIANSTLKESMLEDALRMYNVQISSKVGFENIKTTDTSSMAGLAKILTKITGFKDFSTSNAQDGEFVSKENDAPYIATFDHFSNAMDNAKGHPNTTVTVEKTNGLLTMSYKDGKWTISQKGFELKEMSIKDIEHGSYIGSTLYKVPSFSNLNQNGVFKDSKHLDYIIEDNDLTPDYKTAYTWYAYYLDYYLFGNASFDEYVLTSNISSAFFTAGSLMITDTYGGLAKIDLGNLTKRADIENPDNWMVSSLPKDYCYLREDNNVSGGYYYFYNGSIIKISKNNAIISSTIFKPECLYNNDGIIIMGGAIYSQDMIEEMFIERYAKYGDVKLSDELKANLKTLQDKSMFKNLTCPAAFYSTDGGSSFKPIPIDKLDLLGKDKRINNEGINTCIGSIRFFNGEYQFNIARVQDVENPDGKPVDFTYYYRVVKDENTGLYNFNQVTSDSESGLEFADKDAETLSLGNAVEFDADFTTGVKEKDDTSGEDFTGSGASGTVRFFVTPNRNNFYLATSSGLNMTGEVTVTGKTTTTLTLSENLVPIGTGKIDVLLSFNTANDIFDQMQYLNSDNMESYLNSHGSLRLKEYTEVDGKETADRFYSYRELLEDPTDKNGYPTVDEDKDHAYYNYTPIEMVSGETYLSPDPMKNDSGNIIKLCNEEGILFGRTAYGSQLFTITDRFSLPMESYLDAHDTKFPSLEALDSSFDDGETALVPLEKDTILTRVLDTDDEMMKVTRISKDIGTPGINIAIHIKREVSDVDTENDLVEKATVYTDENGQEHDNGLLYRYDLLEPTKLFASYLLKVTKEITQEQFNLCISEPDTSDRGKQHTLFINLIQSIQKPSTDGTVEYRYMSKETATSKRYYWYDDYFKVYPLAYRRILSSYLDMPYYFAGIHGYKGANVSEVNGPNYNPLSGVYISQYGYGGTRNNTDVNWSEKLPWNLDPDAFVKVTDSDGNIKNEDLYLKNNIGGYIYLTDNTGKKIYSLNSEKIMKAEDIFEVSDSNISANGVQKMTVEDSLGNKSSVSAYRIQQAKVQTYTPMKSAVLGAQPFEWTFYAYKPGMLINDEITDVSIKYLYNNSAVVESLSAENEFDIEKIKLGLLSYKGLDDDSSEMYFNETYGIYPEQLSIIFKYKDKFENHRIDLSLGEKSSSTIIMSRPLFYMQNLKDDNYSLVPYLFSKLDFASEDENDIILVDGFDEEKAVIIGYDKTFDREDPDYLKRLYPGYFSEESLDITVSSFDESVYCANERDFAPLNYMPVMITEGTIFPEESDNIELKFNTFDISSIESPSINLATYKSNEPMFNIDLPIFTFGNILAFALVSIEGVRHNYWDDLTIDTSCRLYLDDTQLSIGNDKSIIMELDEENHMLNFGIQNRLNTFGLIDDPTTRIRFLLKSIEMDMDSSFYSMDGKHINTHDMMLDENGELRPRFIDLSVYDKLNLSIIEGYDYKIKFLLYIIDKFQGSYINELNSGLGVLNWKINYKMADGNYLPIEDTYTSHTYFMFKAPYLESVDFTNSNASLHNLYTSNVVSIELNFEYDGMSFVKELPISWGYMVTPEITDTYASVAYKKDSTSVNNMAKTIKILPERNMVRLDYPNGLDTLMLGGSGEPLTLTAVTYDLPLFNSSSIGAYDRDGIARELQRIAVSKSSEELRRLIWDVESFDNSFRDSTREFSLTSYLQGFDYETNVSDSYAKRAIYKIATVLGDLLADREKPNSIMNHIEGFIGEAKKVESSDGGINMDTWYETNDGTGFKNLVDYEENKYNESLTTLLKNLYDLRIRYTNMNVLYDKDDSRSYAKVFKGFDSFMYLLDDKSISSQYCGLDLSPKEELDRVFSDAFDRINIFIKRAKMRTQEFYDKFYLKDEYTKHVRGVVSVYEICKDFDKLTDFVGEITSEGLIKNILIYADNLNNFARKELVKIAHHYRKSLVEDKRIAKNEISFEMDDDCEVYVYYKEAYYHINSERFIKWLYDLNEGVHVISNYNHYHAFIEEDDNSISPVHLEVDDKKTYTITLGSNEVRNFGCQITIDDIPLCSNDDGMYFGEEKEIVVDGETKIIHDYSVYIDDDFYVNINSEGTITIPEGKEVSFRLFKDMYDDIDVIREVFSYANDYANEYTEKIADFVDSRGYNSYDKKAGDDLSALVESSLYPRWNILDDARYIESEPIEFKNTSADALKGYLEQVLELYNDLVSAKLNVDYAVFGEFLKFINKDTKLRSDIYNNFKSLWIGLENGIEYEKGHIVSEEGKFPLNFNAEDYGTYTHNELNEMLQSLGYRFRGDLENPLQPIDFQNGTSYKLMESLHYMKEPVESLIALDKYDDLNRIGELLCEKMFWIGKIAHAASEFNEIAVMIDKSDMVRFTNEYPEYNDSDNVMDTYRNSIVERDESKETYNLQMETVNSLILESKGYLDSIKDSLYLRDTITNILNTVYSRYESTSDLSDISLFVNGDESGVRGILLNGVVQKLLYKGEVYRRENIEKDIDRIADRYTTWQRVKDDGIIFEYIDNEAMLYMDDCYYSMDKSDFEEWLKNLNASGKIEIDYYDYKLFDRNDNLYRFRVDDGFSITVGDTGTFVIANGEQISLDGFKSLWEDMDDVAVEFKNYALNDDYNDFTKDVYGFFRDNSEFNEVAVGEFVDIVLEKNKTYSPRTLEYASYEIEPQMHDYMERISQEYTKLSNDYARMEQCLENYHNALDTLQNKRSEILKQVLIIANRKILNIEDLEGLCEISKILERSNAYIQTNESGDSKGILKLMYNDRIFEAFPDTDKDAIASLVVDVVKEEDEVFQRVTAESLESLLLEYQYNYTGIKRNIFNVSPDATCKYSGIFVEQFREHFNNFFGNGFMNNYNAYYKVANEYLDTVIRVLTEYTKKAMGNVNVTYPETDVPLGVSVDRNGELPRYVRDIEKVFHDYVLYNVIENGETVPKVESLKNYLYHELMVFMKELNDIFDVELNDTFGLSELPEKPWEVVLPKVPNIAEGEDINTRFWQEYAKFRYLKIARNMMDEWHGTTRTEEVLLADVYLDIKEGRVNMFAENVNERKRTPENGFTPILPSKFFASQNTLTQGFTRPNLKADYPDTVDTRTVIDLGYYSLLSVFNDPAVDGKELIRYYDDRDKRVDESLQLPKYKNGMKYIIEEFETLEDSRIYHNDLELPYLMFYDIFWEYKEGKNIVPHVDTGCRYMLTFVGETYTDDEGVEHKKYSTPVVVKDGDNVVSTDSIRLKVTKLSKEEPDTALVTGISDYIKFRKPTFENMYELISNLGYVIDNPNNLLAVSMDSNGKYLPDSLDKVSFNIVDTENALANFTSNLSLNERIFQAARGLGVKLDDGNEHYIQLKLLTHSTVSTDIMTANDRTQFVKLNLSDIVEFTPDRVYYHPDGYSAPPFRLHNLVFNGGNIDNYNTNFYKNNNLEKVYRCNSDGMLIGYNILSGNRAEKFDIVNDTTCAGYLVDDETGKVSNVVQMYVLDKTKNTLKNAVNTYEPLYKSCKDWFKEGFYIEGKESNPYWQALIIDSKFDNMMKQWKQRTRVVEYIRSSTQMVEQEVDEKLRYLNVSPAIKPNIINDELNIDYNVDFVDMTTGELRFFVRQPTEYYKNTKSFVKYGISAANSFYKSGTSPYRTIWIGSNIDVSGSVSSSYTINSFRNFANKNDRDHAIRQVTEFGLFNKYHEMIAYATFPPIEYRTDSQHISFTCYIKMGRCK